MATDVSRAKSTPPSKYDAFVASQLAQAEKRIRLLDLTAGLLGFAALSLAYVVGMVLCDSKLFLSQHSRQMSLYLFLAGSAIYLLFVVLRPLRLRVNPYYAARQVEEQLPLAKNSIVNWVDLHAQPLPPAIRGALGQRAAKDLSRVDLERAISGRRAAWMGGLAALFALAFLASFFLLGPAPFASLLKRTFNPFETVGISTRTQLTILKPEGGNAAVTVGRGINFVVEVNGMVPGPKDADAVKLLYRYDESEPWQERLLIEESGREWTTSLSAIEVRNGFWYRITGGDAATEEYRVRVRAAPAVTDFRATYHFRPYVARADEVRRDRELKALRGTEVLLRIRTNRALRDGRLEFEGKAMPVQGEVDPNDPHSLFVRFVLDEDGKYRVVFTSTEGEGYSDPIAYAVKAVPDKPPTVELTKPGRNIRLPADALLHLEGKASDDIGVKSLVLRMRVIAGDELREQPYRNEDALRLADGGHPREVEYKDFVELSRVQYEDGRAAALRAGMELEYWLEASDACDYDDPRDHVAKSKRYRVLLTEPEKDEQKHQQEKKQADKDKKQHEQKQDQKFQQENQERQQQRQEQEQENKARSASEGSKRADGEPSQKQQGEQTNDGESTNKNGPQGKSTDSQGNQDNEEKNGELSKEDRKIEERIKQALKRKEASENAKGEGKPDNGDQGGAKGEPQNKPDGGGAAGTKSEGETKGADQQNAKEAGEGKDKGQPQAGSNSAQGEGKGDKSEPKGGKQGSADAPRRPADSRSDPPTTGEGKSKPQPMGQGSGSAGDRKAAAGQAKGEGDKPERKQGGPASRSEPSAADDAKPDAAAQARNATEKDIKDLARALKSKNAHQREQARRQLERIEKQAADAKTREKAGEALKKVGEPDGDSPKSGNSPAGEPKGTREDAADSKGRGSSASEEGDKGTASNRKDGQSGKKGKEPSSAGASRGPRVSQGGNQPGGGVRRSDTGDAAGQGDALPPQGKAAKPRAHRAAQMQLEDFAKKVNKDILKDAGVSEEAWKKYLESRRKQLAVREKPRPETPAAPRQAAALPSMGGRTIQPAASGQSNAHGPDRGQPPPGYRNPFREFTRKMSKSK